MSVSKHDRKESKTKFDAVYFRIYDDAVFLTENNFGATNAMIEKRKLYIANMRQDVMKIVLDINTHIRIANSIFPQCKSEYEERRIYQDKAIGLCYALLTKYHLVMDTLRINGNKYVQSIKNVQHEINCLKKWRESNYKQFGHLG